MKAELNIAWEKGDTEIDLFRKMSIILSEIYNVAFIAETHQHRVSYYSNTISQIAQRELSDLWIIAFSPSQNRIRTTFLQAKYHRKNLLTSGIFHADFFQFELLSTKATLLTGSSFNFPEDCLSFSCCGSVGSYGVFYVDNTTSIDMAYSSAEILTAATSPTNYGQISVDLSFPTSPISINNCNCIICSELNYTYDIDFFTKNLLQLNIGAELQINPKMLAYIRALLSKLDASTTTTQLITTINNISPIDDANNNLEMKSEGNPNVLIINVDEQISNK